MPTEILNMIPVEFRPVAIVVFFLAGAIFFWLKWTDTIPQGSLGIRTNAGAIKLRYNRKKYSKAEIARQKAVDEKLVKSAQPAKYGRPKIWQPGLHLQVMIYHRYDKIVAQDQPFDIDDIVVTKDDGYRGVLFAQAKVYVCAKSKESVYLMRVATSDLPATLRAVVNTELSRIMRLHGYDVAVEMGEAFRQEVTEELKRTTEKRFARLGIRLVGLDLGTAVEVTQLATGRAVSELGGSITIAGLAASLGSDPVDKIPREQ